MLNTCAIEPRKIALSALHKSANSVTYRCQICNYIKAKYRKDANYFPAPV